MRTNQRTTNARSKDEQSRSHHLLFKKLKIDLHFIIGGMALGITVFVLPNSKMYMHIIITLLRVCILNGVV